MYNKRNAKQLLEVKVHAAHLSPATPLLESYEDDEDRHHHHHHHHHNASDAASSSSGIRTTHGTMDIERTPKNTSFSDSTSTSSSGSEEYSNVSTLRTISFNTLVVFGVFIAGIAGWWVSERRHLAHPGTPGEDTPEMEFDFWGQIFGWGCAVLYLGSRFPQILLNFQRKSVEGISFLFFLFACLGNLTYIISILALDISPKYLLINGSWLAGSVGTLFLDLVIFGQFWVYNRRKPGDEDEDFEEDEE